MLQLITLDMDLLFHDDDNESIVPVGVDAIVDYSMNERRSYIIDDARVKAIRYSPCGHTESELREEAEWLMTNDTKTRDWIVEQLRGER